MAREGICDRKRDLSLRGRTWRKRPARSRDEGGSKMLQLAKEGGWHSVAEVVIKYSALPQKNTCDLVAEMAMSTWTCRKAWTGKGQAETRGSAGPEGRTFETSPRQKGPWMSEGFWKVQVKALIRTTWFPAMCLHIPGWRPLQESHSHTEIVTTCIFQIDIVPLK